MNFDIDFYKQGVVIHFKGYVDGEIMLSAACVIQSDKHFDELLYIVADYTDCTEFSASGSDFDQAIAMTAASSLTNNKFRLARVSTAPDIIAAANRYTELRLNISTPPTFSTLEAAFEWLGVNKFGQINK